jgi:hypothetical protein
MCQAEYERQCNESQRSQEEEDWEFACQLQSQLNNSGDEDLLPDLDQVHHVPHNTDEDIIEPVTSQLSAETEQSPDAENVSDLEPSSSGFPAIGALDEAEKVRQKRLQHFDAKSRLPAASEAR